MTVALDIESIFEDAQAHVMLSRVQQLDQVFIVEKFNESKIRTSQTALDEMRRLEEISMNKNPTPWKSNYDPSIKVMAMNCAGLKPHIEDIRTDEKTMQADIIHLIETSLNENEVNQLKIRDYEVNDCSVRKGMGISTHYKKDKFKIENNYAMMEIQVSKFTSENLDVITVYRSRRGSTVVLKSILKQLVGKNGKGNPDNRGLQHMLHD